MADKNDSLVKVNLDRKRGYKLHEADRRAVWVGPGEAEVPHWVAEHWGLVEAVEQPQTDTETEPEPTGKTSRKSSKGDK